MTTIHSPNNIDVLLHYHTRMGPHEGINAPAVIDAISFLLQLGAIKPRAAKNEYETTELGKAWVQALCNVPPPKQVFVDQLGKILNEPL